MVTASSHRTLIDRIPCWVCNSRKLPHTRTLTTLISASLESEAPVRQPLVSIGAHLRAMRGHFVTWLLDGEHMMNASVAVLIAAAFQQQRALSPSVLQYTGRDPELLTARGMEHFKRWVRAPHRVTHCLAND